jgi:hypothetical protein
LLEPARVAIAQQLERQSTVSDRYAITNTFASYQAVTEEPRYIAGTADMGVVGEMAAAQRCFHAPRVM